MVRHVARCSAIATASARQALKTAADSFSKGFWGAMGGTMAGGLVYLAHKWVLTLLTP